MDSNNWAAKVDATLVERRRSRHRVRGRDLWLVVPRKTLSFPIPSRFGPVIPLIPCSLTILDIEIQGLTRMVNWGCIPAKALLKNAELYQTLSRKASVFGLKIDGLSYDWQAVIGRSRKVSDRLAGGIEFLLKKNRKVGGRTRCRQS